MSANRRYTFDTNILFYATDSSAGEKHLKALSLINSALAHDCVILLQSLGELSNSTIKRRAASSERVRQIVSAYRRSFPIVSTSENDLDQALLAHQQHKLPLWDAMLWATARRAGCTLILTENFADDSTLGGVTFRNPFALSSTELESLLE
jgi:predicted nucleic acid-binding protein